MALAHTARMDASASAAGRANGRVAARGGANGFSEALDVAGGARGGSKAAPSETRADDATPEPADRRAAEARRETRAGGTAPGRPVAVQRPERAAGADKTVKVRGSAAQEGPSSADGPEQGEAVQDPAKPVAPEGGTPDEGTVARLAGLALKASGAEVSEDDDTASEEAAAGSEPGAVPVLPFLAALLVPHPTSAVPGGASLAGRVQGGGTTGPEAVGGAGPGLTGATGALPDAATGPGATGAQAHATAILLGEGRAGRSEPAGEAGTPVVSKSETTEAKPELKPDILAALGEAVPGGIPAAEAAKTSHLQAAAAQQAPTGPSATPPVPLGQVPMTIGLRSLAGSSQFEIRLDPVDLGRIDVTLEIDKERGTVMTHLVVERVDTLAMLQRDAGNLQQALSQAGLDASADGGIRLSLRGDGAAQDQAQGQARGDTGGQEGRGRRAGWAGEGQEAAEVAPLRTLRGLGGLDIRI